MKWMDEKMKNNQGNESTNARQGVEIKFLI